MLESVENMIVKYNGVGYRFYSNPNSKTLLYEISTEELHKVLQGLEIFDWIKYDQGFLLFPNFSVKIPVVKLYEVAHQEFKPIVNVFMYNSLRDEIKDVRKKLTSWT